jgi:hypothetical protein
LGLVPALKCLGSGYYYLFNSAFPTALAAGVILSKGVSIGTTALLTLAILGNIAALLAYYRNLKKLVRSQPGFQEVLDFLKCLPKATVMCLPPQWYDELAYKTGQPVLYGGHGLGFRLLEPTFPRLLLPIKEIIERYQVRYLITLKGYLPDRFLADLPYESLKSFGEYQVFITKPCV